MFSGSSVADFIESATNTDLNDSIIIDYSPFNIFMNSAKIRDVVKSNYHNKFTGATGYNVDGENKFKTLGRNPGKKDPGNPNNNMEYSADSLNNKNKQGKYEAKAKQIKLSILHNNNLKRMRGLFYRNSSIIIQFGF